MTDSDTIRRSVEEIKAEIRRCKRMARECLDEGSPEFARQWHACADILEWVIGPGRYEVMEATVRQKAEHP